MNQLPPGWRWSTLGQIADVVGGVTKDSKREGRPDLVEVPYLRVANVQRGRIDLTRVSTIRVPIQKAEQLRLMPGDVLLNEGGDRDKLGRGWVWQGEITECIHQNHVFRARIKNDILHPKLLAWYANEVAHKWFETNGKQSVNLASISLSKIRTFPVPIPPVEEQQRIVEILDGHLSNLDATRKQLTAAGQRTGAWRRSIIDTIIGRVDEPWLPVGELLSEPMRNGLSAPAVRDGDAGIRTLTLTAVTRGVFADSYTKMTSADPRKAARLWLTAGDILVQRANTPELVGTTALYQGPDDWAIYPDLLIRLRARPDIATAQYLAAVLRSERIHRTLRQKAKGLAGSMPKIDQAAIASTTVPVPSVERQIDMVRVLADIEEASTRLTSAIVAAGRREALLRRMLLQSAFAGQLGGRTEDMGLIEEMAGV